jgi:serine phosphatase RsbU (regulator of sigma subunit)/putative methionine-R-sulfoxide reductase with GAF domain
MPEAHHSLAAASGESLQREVEKNLLIQQALTSILRISLAAISLDEQMHRILSLILELPWLALERQGCIYLADEDAKVLVRKAQVGMPAGALSSCGRVPFGTCLCGLAIATKEIVFANCLDARHSICYPGMLPHGHYCVPISSGERRLGLLNLYVREGHQWSSAEERFLRAVADVLGGVIERHRTQERLLEQLIERKKAERRLAAEHAVSQILAVASSLRNAASAILRAICESLDWDVGILWAVDRSANVLRCVEVWHSPETEVTPFEQDSRQRTYLPGAALPGRVWASGKLAWVPDLAAETDFPRASIAARTGVHAAVAFPVRNGVHFLGVMEFLSRGIRQPDDELIEMMTSIGSQISQFIERREAESELRRQEEDRRIAHKVQQGLLPQAVPTFAGFRIGGRSVPAQDVGGDCFDFIPLRMGNEECLGVLVADASGHGIGAALLVGQARAYLQALALACTDVGTLLTLSNQRLASDVVDDHFVTLFLMRLDSRTRSLAYANAGHWPGYILDRQGRTKAVLASTGIPLGIDSAQVFPAGPPAILEPGELVLLFTDGILEAASPDGQLFGLERILSIVRAHQQETPDANLDALFHAVEDFSGHQLQDDITAVIIKAESLP